MHLATRPFRLPKRLNFCFRQLKLSARHLFSLLHMSSFSLIHYLVAWSR
jgi:hypothetical protein